MVRSRDNGSKSRTSRWPGFFMLREMRPNEAIKILFAKMTKGKQSFSVPSKINSTIQAGNPPLSMVNGAHKG